MDPGKLLDGFRGELEDELRAVTVWWLKHGVDLASGEIAGEISNGNCINRDAGWSLVYVARLLWFFSAVYRHQASADCRDAAKLCRMFLEHHFLDRENGGLFWSLDARKRPESRKKQTYGQAFAVYGLSEFARAFNDDDAKSQADQLVETLGRHTHDREYGGYLEALDRFWQPVSDMRLGGNDTNAEKTMNTHLHVLEAYAAYFGVNPDAATRTLLAGLTDLFLRRFQEPSGGHLLQYCSRDWTVYPAGKSFGHDIEAGWLLCEAADAIGDPGLQARTRNAALALSDGVLAQGLDADGAVMYGQNPNGTSDPARVWWVQAESTVGFFNAWQRCGEQRFLEASLGCWAFIREHQRDREHGEWTWFSARDKNAGSKYKAGAWKGPYHNGRALLEMIRRIDGVLAKR